VETDGVGDPFKVDTAEMDVFAHISLMYDGGVGAGAKIKYTNQATSLNTSQTTTADIANPAIMAGLRFISA
jgi:hypothetical protein